MTKFKFTSKVYELLNHGLIEIGGKIYYSEASVLTAMEWMKDNMQNIIEVDAEKMIETLNTNLKNIMEQFTSAQPKQLDKQEVAEATSKIIDNLIEESANYESEEDFEKRRKFCEEHNTNCKVELDHNGNVIKVILDNPNFDGKYTDL